MPKHLHQGLWPSPRGTRLSLSLSASTLASASLLACIFQADSALAAGFAIRNQSASSSGTSLASDNVNISDASGIFANPAIMSELKGHHVTVNADYLRAGITLKDASLSNTTSTGAIVPNPQQGQTEFDKVSDPIVLPSFYGTHEINQEIHVGWALTVPWATNVEYDKGWAGRYHAVKTQVAVTELALSGSYRLNETLNLAFGLLAQSATGSISQANDLGLINSLNPATANPALIGNADAISEYEAKNTAFGWQFGLLYKPMPSLRVGFSFKSPIQHKTEGDLKFTADPGAGSAILEGLRADYRFQDSSDAKLDLNLPSITSLAAAYTLGTYTIYGNLAHTAWSSLKDFNIRYGAASSNTKLEWKNSLFVALGADHQLNEALILRAGLFHDQGVTTDKTRTPRTPDADRTGISVGAGYRLSEMLKVNAAYQRIFVDEAKVDLSDQAYADLQLRGNLKSTFEINPNLFIASADFSF